VVEAVNMTLRRVQLLIVALGALPSAAFAHVLDEYLQATLVAIEPGEVRLQINLTPGVEVADKILTRIDRNRDGVVSKAEAATYSELLKRDLTVRLDGRETELKLTESNIPAPAELRTGHGIIQVEFMITPGSFSAGRHWLVFENRHFNSLGAYLFNAGRPRSASIQIARQNRNANQSTGEIEFAYDAPSHSSNAIGPVALFAVILLAMAAAAWRIRTSSRSSSSSLWPLQNRP
jgi:hypothetical protein